MPHPLPGLPDRPLARPLARPWRAPCALGAGLLIGLLAAPGAGAGSLATSSAAGGSSASSASSAFSDASSDSSGTRTAAAGLWQVVAVADQPGTDLALLLLQAQALDAPAPDAATRQLRLLLPRALLAQQGLAAGRLLRARAEAYGALFVDAQTQAPLFVQHDDAAQRELAARPVRL